MTAPDSGWYKRAIQGMTEGFTPKPAGTEFYISEHSKLQGCCGLDEALPPAEWIQQDSTPSLG